MSGHVSASPEVIEQEIQEARLNGEFGYFQKRSGMKVPSTATKIAVCIPMGVKDDPDVFQCQKCQHRQLGERLRVAGMVPLEFALSIQQIVMPLITSTHYFYRKSIPSARAREQMTHEARKVGVKYIFYLDDDVLLQPHTLYDLYNMMERHPEAAIISGVYCTRQEVPEPIVYQKHGDGAFWDFAVERGVLEPIFAAGAGCLMARVEALEDVERILGRPLWDDEYDGDENTQFRRMWGHDIRFCKRMHETAAHYKPEADIGLMTKNEATRLAQAELSEIEGPKVGVRADEIMREAREKRSQALIEAGSARAPWQVYLAGWVQCYHWDAKLQKAFALPADAPCFQNSNTRGYWDNLALVESKWSELGVPQLRSSEKYIHPRVEQLVRPGDRVVDVGCYTGALGDRLIKRKQVQYRGIDISGRAIEELKRRHMEGVVADIGVAEIELAGDEIVVCLEVLEHLDDARLANALTQLAKGRYAIITVPKGEIGAPHKEHVREFHTTDDLFALLKPHFKHVFTEEIAPHYLMAVSTNRDARKAKAMMNGSGVLPRKKRGKRHVT